MQIKLLIFIMSCLAATTVAADEDSLDLFNFPVPDFSGPLDSDQPYAQVTYIQAGGSIDLRNGKANRHFIVQALVYLPKESDAIGISHQVQINELTDENGRDMLNHAGNARQIIFVGPRRYSSLARRWRDGARHPISINTSLHGLAKIPPMYQSIRGSTWVLLADRRIKHQVSPILVGEFIELAPSLLIQVVSMQRKDNAVHIELRYIAEAAGPFLDPNSTPPFVDRVVLIDAAGNEIEGRGGAPDQNEGQKDIFHGQDRFVFTMPSGSEPQAIQFGVVTATQEYKVEFAAKNVKLPIAPAPTRETSHDK